MPRGIYVRPPKLPASSRFWGFVRKDGPMPANRRDLGNCWLWTGYRTALGYGKFWDGYRKVMAHRWSYEDAQRPDAAGKDLDHLCRVRSCVNPDHLEAVSHRENILRGETFGAANVKKTHCIRGHEYSGANIGARRGKPGWRVCRKCAAEDQKHIRARRRERDQAA